MSDTTPHVCTDFTTEPPCNECRQAATIRQLEEQVQRYQEREAHFAKDLAVADGGQYRADWPAAIERVLAERDALKVQIKQLSADLDRAAGLALRGLLGGR